LAPTVGTLGVEIMNSMAFLLSANNNSKVDGNQISFGTVDFQPHPPNRAPVFASLDQEMDLTIGSLNFRVGSLGSIRLSNPTKSEPSVGFSSEVNSPVSFAKISIEDKIEELDKIMGNLDLGEAMDRLDLDQKDFTIQSGSVSSNVHQVCVIITETAEENNDTDNIVA
jgi:hypothetical protein